jgi:hypothetical protein
MPTFPTDHPALQAQLNAQVDFFTQMSRHAVDAAGQIGELNLRMMRQMAACKDPFQMGAVAMRETQPTVEHLRAWQGELMTMLGAGTATLARDANNSNWQAARGAGSFMGAGSGGAAPDGKAAHAPVR